MITMYDHIDNIVDKSPEIYKSGVGSAAATAYNISVCEPQNKNNLLSDKKQENFHTLTERCLYVFKQGILDLQILVAFHCTRVRNPTRDE